MSNRDLANFVHGCADAMAGIGGNRFWPRLTALLGRLVRHHSSVVFSYAGSDPPVFVFGGLDSEVSRGRFHEYRERAYLLDPFYGRFRAGPVDAVHRLRDVSADRFFRSVYFRQYFRKTGLCDEMGIFCRIGDERLIIVSLMRRIDEPVFTRAEVRKISGYLPIIAAMIRLQDGACDETRAPRGRAEPETAPQPMLLPESDLTPRESTIGELILKGHSSLSISLLLGISVETVRVHRRNLYRKLNVASQAQLFALAIHGTAG